MVCDIKTKICCVEVSSTPMVPSITRDPSTSKTSFSTTVSESTTEDSDYSTTGFVDVEPTTTECEGDGSTTPTISTTEVPTSSLTTSIVPGDYRQLTSPSEGRIGRKVEL